MMTTLHEFPFFPINFNKKGEVVAPTEVAELLAHLSATPVTDLLVLSHGWNNDTDEAHALYDGLLGFLRRFAPVGRTFAVLGVQWPSKKFADSDLIPGGAASGASQVADAELLAQLELLRGAFDANGADAALDEAKSLVPLLEDKQTARTRFADLLKSVLAGVETATTQDIDGLEHVQGAPSSSLVEKLGQPDLLTTAPAAAEGTPALGHVAGLGDIFSDIKAGARNLLNFTTYYQMKERAGLVGSTGLRGVLASIKQVHPALKLHLVGHSFGGRLVTAAISGQDQFEAASLSLLQAAFSHYGFSDSYDDSHKPGFFRPLLTSRRVTGPVLATHTAADFAVGRMYPLASRLAGQVAADLGGPTDTYGGIGRNGAQKTPEATTGTLLRVPGTYAFAPGRIHNLNADGIIGNHSDISREEVAAAIMQAVATT
ncbi:hypothetical protein MUN81_11660 [Hymenobacter sp. 5317J-9]|uniref:hypothetical protein n=1 Tax=Hymenobacter sp. 5317J-9 TaxID=2932250 RepID=UPI001FD63B0C|nr:hypothetical protein [Hymenobacter sp. 5317J-9]UOQ95919.1 hypothetical protein MUN81_11660 [Hymenobacter sp. 5317J-9]